MKIFLIFPVACLLILSCKDQRANDVPAPYSFDIKSLDLKRKPSTCLDPIVKSLNFTIRHNNSSINLSAYKILIRVDGDVLFYGKYAANIPISFSLCNRDGFNINSIIEIDAVDEKTGTVYLWARKNSYDLTKHSQVSITLLSEYKETDSYEIKLD